MLKQAVTAAIFLIASQISMATLFLYEDNNASNGGIADRLDSLSSTYDDASQVFTWDVNFNSDPTDVDGFWLVVNNGPNPKNSDVNELAIIYGDLSTNTATTYVYNGLNNANSWSNPGIFLQTDSFSSDSNSLSLSLDATSINSWAGGDYTGISFDDSIGIWFHISTGSSFSYSLEGFINDYGFQSQGWYDIQNRDTTQVPEPGIFVLFGIGLVLMGISKRKKAHS